MDGIFFLFIFRTLRHQNSPHPAVEHHKRDYVSVISRKREKEEEEEKDEEEARVAMEEGREVWVCVGEVGGTGQY